MARITGNMAGLLTLGGLDVVANAGAGSPISPLRNIGGVLEVARRDPRFSPMLKPLKDGERRLARSVYFIVERLPRDISLRTLLEEFEAAGAEEAMPVLLDAGDAPVRALAARVL